MNRTIYGSSEMGFDIYNGALRCIDGVHSVMSMSLPSSLSGPAGPDGRASVQAIVVAGSALKQAVFNP